jgi:hypothetical protein
MVTLGFYDLSKLEPSFHGVSVLKRVTKEHYLDVQDVAWRIAQGTACHRYGLRRLARHDLFKSENHQRRYQAYGRFDARGNPGRNATQ